MRAPALLLAAVIAAGASCSPVDRTAGPGAPRLGSLPRPAASATPERAVFWIEAPIAGDPTPFQAVVPASGAVAEPGRARLLRPAPLTPPRRVGIQVGHWKAAEAPDEFPNLRFQLGASFGGVDEVDLNLDIADRVAAILRADGVTVDILPATIPPGYLADAFVALHADGDDYREARGFKTAHGFHRSPHDGALVATLTDSYHAATELPWDDNVSGDMTDYYAFAWYRYVHALSPFTPAAILEMGFLSQEEDRVVLLDRPEVVARGVANGIARFLAATPQASIVSQEIVVPTVPPK